jgi:hypothetical protein
LQRERAEGRFEIHIEERPGDGEWRLLRRAMRLSRADVEWLKQRVPGVVRRGAEVDLAPVVERINEAGIRASLRRRTRTPGGEALGRVNDVSRVDDET